MRAALIHSRAQAYLAYRQIPLAVAQSYCMGYLPPIIETNRTAYERNKMLRYWSDSLVTPTVTPWGGVGYTARKLTMWEEGMDEETHKALLKEKHLPRIIKTGNAGWLWRPDELGHAVIMVEGKFEVFALVAAGFLPHEVVGVMTNSANIDWLPTQVRSVIVAFNGDERGRSGAKRLLTGLLFAGIQGVDCPPPADGRLGSDCSARWRSGGDAGLSYLFEAWEHTTKNATSYKSSSGLA